MEGEVWFDEEVFFRTLAASGARILLIGRRGLVLLGAPVMTHDYDLWVHIDDIELVNQAVLELDLEPNRSPSDARARGRYVLEGAAHVDVMVARGASTKDDATPLHFDDAWSRRNSELVGDVAVFIPSIDDYILTKRWSLRAHDLQDILFLEALKKLS